ncbi:MAG TPA: hypothetical protein VLV83_02365 [Acidobacteriota bacterium]|nr:hypothetical protein [Acidobacteriota bacterium]
MSLDLQGSLRVRASAPEFTIEFRGREIVLQFDSIKAARQNMESFSQLAGPSTSEGSRGKTVAQIHEWLKRLELTVALQVGQEELARLGSESEPSWAGKLLGFPDLQLRPLGWLKRRLFKRDVKTD